MLSLNQGALAVKLARSSIESVFKNNKIPEVKDKTFDEKLGVFVTLHSYPSKELRGCIGFPYPILPLKEALAEAAKSSAFEDSRFLPLNENELKKIIIEISVLTKPEQIKADIKNIEIGKDGLICSCNNSSGLLLPQVALEQKWNSKTLLEQTCIKAGLPKEAWKSKECKVYKFQAQIFIEIKPNGNILEKQDI